MSLIPNLKRNNLLNLLVSYVTQHPINSSYVIQLIIPSIHRWTTSSWRSPYGEIFAVKPFWPNEIYVKMVGVKCAQDCCSGRLFRKVWIQFLLPNKLFYTHTYMQSVFLCPNITTMWPKKLWIHILRFAIFKYGELFLMPRSQQHTLCMCEAPRNLWSGCSPSIRNRGVPSFQYVYKYLCK